jgi:hypothetical protein
LPIMSLFLKSPIPSSWCMPGCQPVTTPTCRRLVCRRVAGGGNISFTHAWALTLLGLDSYCAVAPDDLRAQEVRQLLADRLTSSLASVETPAWVGFEDGLAYDNARLLQALMLASVATQTPFFIDPGLRSLRWLMTQQTGPGRSFSPRRHSRSRRSVTTSTGIRSATAGRYGDDCGPPDGIAGGASFRLESHRDPRFRLVTRQQRSSRCACRSADRKLS